MIPKQIIHWVAGYFELPPEVLFSRDRSSYVSWIRWIAMKLIHDHLKMSSTEIGLIFEKDHGTILHGLDAVNKLRGWKKVQTRRCVKEFGKSAILKEFKEELVSCE